jgi:alkylation response protein AidB-like acyl-CoA dehydrogenase
VNVARRTIPSDTKLLEIGAGTTEIRKLIIGRELHDIDAVAT